MDKTNLGMNKTNLNLDTNLILAILFILALCSLYKETPLLGNIASGLLGFLSRDLVGGKTSA